MVDVTAGGEIKCKDCGCILDEFSCAESCGITYETEHPFSRRNLGQTTGNYSVSIPFDVCDDCLKKYYTK